MELTAMEILVLIRDRLLGKWPVELTRMSLDGVGSDCELILEDRNGESWLIKCKRVED